VGAAAAQQSGPATLKEAPPQASTARMESFLGVKEKVRGEWKTMYCVLQKSILSMYPTKEIAEAGRQPFRTVSSLNRIIGTLNRIIGTFDRIIGTLDRIIGTLNRLIGTLNRIIGTLNRIISTLSGSSFAAARPHLAHMPLYSYGSLLRTINGAPSGGGCRCIWPT
jgi:hypothetical protein